MSNPPIGVKVYLDGNGKPLPEPVPLRQAHHVPHLDAKKSFTATAQADRLKEYIKDIPVLRARIIKAVEHLEALVAQEQALAVQQQAQLALARESLKMFDEAAELITTRFVNWEKTHDGPQPVVTADPAAGSAGAASGPEPVGRA